MKAYTQLLFSRVIHQKQLVLIIGFPFRWVKVERMKSKFGDTYILNNNIKNLKNNCDDYFSTNIMLCLRILGVTQLYNKEITQCFRIQRR